jgi:hypothetical protein
MKKAGIIETHGSIWKKEALNPITYRILENTVVAEAGDPYADYYGNTPNKFAPNSLFLLTKRFYSLKEVLEVTCEMGEFFGYTKKLDIATSILDFTDHYHYAIRVRDFPDYEHIHWLQLCYKSSGIEFIRKVHLLDSARVTVFKCLRLEELEKGIYLDIDSEHKGYFTISRQINTNEFEETLINLRNNNDCPLFDAALGTVDIESNTKNIIRIYSENLTIALLRCAKEKFSKQILNKNLQEHY